MEKPSTSPSGFALLAGRMVTWVKIGHALGVMLAIGFGTAKTSAEEAISTPPNPRYTGSWSVREWTTEETGGSPQSFVLIQDPTSGFVYAGNEGGVLEGRRPFRTAAVCGGRERTW